MASITITLPESGLVVSISVRERLTGSLDFSGTMVNTPTVPDIGPTKSYTFDFTEVADTDYTYIATAPGGYYMEGTMYRDSASSGGGATPAQIWEYESRTLTQFSGGGGSVIDMTKKNEDLIDKLKKFEDLISKIPGFKLEDFEIMLKTQISTIEKTDLSQFTLELSKLIVSINSQKALIIDEKNKEKQELILQKSIVEKEKEKLILDLSNKDSIFEEKDIQIKENEYNLKEKEFIINELQKKISGLEEDVEKYEKDGESFIKIVIDYEKQLREKEVKQQQLINAYLSK